MLGHHGRLARLQLLNLDPCPQRGQLRPGQKAGRRRRREADYTTQIRQVRTAQVARRVSTQLRDQLLNHRVVVRCFERPGAHQPLTSRLLEHVVQFRKPVRRVDVDQNHTNLGAGKLADKPFKAIGRPDAQPVAGLQPQRHEATGMQVDSTAQLRPAQALVLMAHNQRLVLGVTRGRTLKRLADVQCQQGLVLRTLAVTGG